MRERQGKPEAGQGSACFRNRLAGVGFCGYKPSVVAYLVHDLRPTALPLHCLVNSSLKMLLEFVIFVKDPSVPPRVNHIFTSSAFKSILSITALLLFVSKNHILFPTTSTSCHGGWWIVSA